MAFPKEKAIHYYSPLNKLDFKSPTKFIFNTTITNIV
jgi:hypothetical protein